MVPPIPRLPEALPLIEQGAYFVVHAPRQTGKSTTLRAICRMLTAEGRYAAVDFTCETAQPTGDDYAQGELLVLSRMAPYAKRNLPPDLHPPDPWPDATPGSRVTTGLQDWAAQCPRPLVLVFDEIDAMQGKSLESVLRQLRDLHRSRPGPGPHSVILCGLRDVRDYKAASGADPSRLGTASPFNIKADSLRLGDFEEREVRCLLGQHTDETGQLFATEAVSEVWKLTMGQPWLVNALAYEACFRIEEGRERSTPITEAMIHGAKERLIVRRETHLDQLGYRLQEERVRRVIEPIINGVHWYEGAPDDDVQYCVDLGLLRRNERDVEVANPIYREIIPRQLTSVTQNDISPVVPSSGYVRADSSLDIPLLLEAFQQFFREHAEHWVERFEYREAGPQLLLQAFLHRVVNGGGRIEREYGVGRGRTDLIVLWPLGDGFGPGKPVQRVVIEIKVVHEKKTVDTVVDEGLRQTAEYLDRCGTDEGHLVVFDKRAGRTWDEKIFKRDETYNGKRIAVWGM